MPEAVTIRNRNEEVTESNGDSAEPNAQGYLHDDFSSFSGTVNPGSMSPLSLLLRSLCYLLFNAPHEALRNTTPRAGKVMLTPASRSTADTVSLGVGKPSASVGRSASK